MSNVYRYADEVTDDILKNPVYVKEEKNGKPVKWIKIPWVSRCEYNSGIGIAIKLNDELKPFLNKPEGTLHTICFSYEIGLCHPDL